MRYDKLNSLIETKTLALVCDFGDNTRIIHFCFICYSTLCSPQGLDVILFSSRGRGEKMIQWHFTWPFVSLLQSKRKTKKA
mmetsp:Transcript_6348/g.15802  ORF Transcript_6348/g.15802 Transcript_6348/m.15802 type:complete len:81 (-) Transcript_6348:994-1236(-)